MTLVLHVGDCPMTNGRPEDRTACICAGEPYCDQPRTYLEGGGGEQVDPTMAAAVAFEHAHPGRLQVEPTSAQTRMLAAYQASRALFGRLDGSGSGVAFQPVHLQNRRLLRYRRQRLPFRSDAHEAIVLIGALSRLEGGQTLGELGQVVQVADITGAWMEALLAAAGLAAVHMLAIGPILEVVLDLVSECDPGPAEPVMILPALTDVCAIAGARTETLPGGDDGAEAVRRAVFAGLGQALTCAWLVFTRRMARHQPIAADETPSLYFVGAVDMLIGAPPPARPGDSDG